jgi:hypothetical protein
LSKIVNIRFAVDEKILDVNDMMDDCGVLIDE